MIIIIPAVQSVDKQSPDDVAPADDHSPGSQLVHVLPEQYFPDDF